MPAPNRLTAPGNRKAPAKASRGREPARHSLKHVFTCEDISVQTKTQRHRPEQNRDDFKEPTAKKTPAMRTFSAPVVFPLGANSSLIKPPGPAPGTPTQSNTRKRRAPSRASDSSRHSRRATTARSPWNPSCRLCPHPMVPTPGRGRTSSMTDMKMKIVAKNQNVRLTK